MSGSLEPSIRAYLDELVTTGPERGLQVAVFRHGERVVDAWAGRASEAPGDAVTGDTVFPIFSTTKGIAATAVHQLVERGKLAYDTPIAEVWPEFGANGKDRITLRQALSHASGLPHLPVGIGFRELCDWETMCERIAALPPSSPPGTETVYHAMTYGWIIGEAARRVDGRPFGRIVRDEIARPLGLTAMYLGIPPDASPHIAVLEETTPPGPRPDDSQPQVVPGWIQPMHRSIARPDVRAACIPATNGIMSARAVARHYAALLPGGVDGVTLLSADTIRAATTPPYARNPEWGLGYQLGGTVFYPDSAAAFGHGGYGGSIGVADRELGLAIAVTKNRFVGDETVRSLVRRIRAHYR